MQDFNNLRVWQAARRLAREVYELTAGFPQSEAFGLKAQMRRASVSICSNIAEGCGRRGDRDFRRFLGVAMGSACELECELILSLDLGFAKENGTVNALALLTEIKRMLSRLMGQLTAAPGTETRSAPQRSVASQPKAESR